MPKDKDRVAEQIQLNCFSKNKKHETKMEEKAILQLEYKIMGYQKELKFLAYNNQELYE